MKLNVPYLGSITVELPYLAGGAVGTLIVLGGLGYWFWGRSTDDSDIAAGTCTPKETYEVTADDFTKGDPKAPITIIEYASMTCPHCARFNNNVLPHLEADWVDKGYVRYVFREFPLDSVALTVSVVGRCLGHDAYLPFVSMMYQTQQTWLSPESQQDLRAAIKEMARRAGMSGDAFEKCMAGGQTDAQKIAAIQKAAVKDYCVGGTPTFLMNGKPLASGEIPYAEIDQKIRAELKRLGKPVPPLPTTPGETAPSPPTATGTAPAPAPTPAGSGATPAPATPAPAAPATGTPPTPPAPAPAAAPATPAPPH